MDGKAKSRLGAARRNRLGTTGMKGLLGLLELELVELVIEAFLLEEFLMVAFFHDLALLEDDDLVGVLDGGKPVGDH